MGIKTFEEVPLYTDHVKPVVQIPPDVREDLSPEALIQIQQEAMENYRASKAALNESIADVAVNDPFALSFAAEMSKRVLTLIEISAQLELVQVDEINLDENQLKKIGVSEEAIHARAPGFLGELKQKNVKTKIISETGSGIEKGNVNEAGFVGFSPLAIQNATDGNLRERLYIPFKTTHGFTGKLLAKPENVKSINERLRHQGESWQLNEAIIDELRMNTGDKRGGLYAYGAYALSRDGSRIEQTKEFLENYTNTNPTVSEQQKTARSPLSERELLGQTGALSTDSDKRIQWLPGEAFSRIREDKAHKTLKAADETGDLMLTGISGTTDSLLTMGHMLGMFNGDSIAKEKAMRNAMLACMGWMVDAKDHTAHEIQTGAKSFGLAYTAGPDSYKQIRPDDAEFIEKLKIAQERRGFKMPEDYLSAEHVRELARKKQAEEFSIHGKEQDARQDPKLSLDKQKMMKKMSTDFRSEEADLLKQVEQSTFKPSSS